MRMADSALFVLHVFHAVKRLHKSFSMYSLQCSCCSWYWRPCSRTYTVHLVKPQNGLHLAGVPSHVHPTTSLCSLAWLRGGAGASCNSQVRRTHNQALANRCTSKPTTLLCVCVREGLSALSFFLEYPTMCTGLFGMDSPGSAVCILVFNKIETVLPAQHSQASARISHEMSHNKLAFHFKTKRLGKRMRDAA